MYDEDALVRRVRQGDHVAFAELVDHYKVAIVQLAFRLTGNYEDALDLGQDIFFKAFKKIHLFDPNKKFYPWLFTIGLNTVRDFIRREKALKSDYRNGINNEIFTVQMDPEMAVFQSKQSEKMLQLLEELPLEIREALVLRYYEDLSFVDIADIMGISVSAAKMRVYRGLSNLKDRIEMTEL